MTTPDDADSFFRNQRREAISRDDRQIGIDYVQISADASVPQWKISLHGRTVRECLPQVPPAGRYRPHLEYSGLTYRVPYDDASARTQAAAITSGQDPRAALPDLTLTADDVSWTARSDLLSSTWDSPDVVIEMANDRTAYLRSNIRHSHSRVLCQSAMCGAA